LHKLPKTVTLLIKRLFTKYLQTKKFMFMKKILVTAVMTATISFAIAQDNTVLTNKKGTPILPKAGSWALGVDATPFLNYAGRIVGQNAANSPTFNGGTFHGKYFLQDNKALRFGININSNSASTITLQTKIGSTLSETLENMNKNITVEDVRKVSFTDVRLFLGCEKRIGGQSRLQGFYGAETVLGFGNANEKIKNTYGNALGTQNPLGWRTLIEKPGARFTIGANAFVGAEYFVAPGISLGGRVGYGIDYTLAGRRKLEEERWHDSKVETQTRDLSGGGRGFRFNNFGGDITLMFHF
jgi:hypothetical protein